MRILAGVVAVAGVVAASAAGAQEPSASNPLMSNLMSCRGEADPEARLRCFDAAAAALDAATSTGAVVVVDRDEVRRTRRALFGFNLPRLPFFGGDTSGQEQEPDEIEGRIESAREIGYGKWQIVLEGGAVWQTTEVETRAGVPRSGQTVRIKKATMGSYMLAVQGQRSVRAMRVR